MADDLPNRSRRQRRAVVPRRGLDMIGDGIAERVPTPEPPGLGAGLLERASQDRGMHHNLEGLIGQLLARTESSGKLIDETRMQVASMDDKLEAIARRLDGVAYQRDITQFVSREEIERKIDRATEGVRQEVAGLRKMGWGLVSAALLAGGGVLLKMILAAAHVPT